MWCVHAPPFSDTDWYAFYRPYGTLAVKHATGGSLCLLLTANAVTTYRLLKKNLVKLQRHKVLREAAAEIFLHIWQPVPNIVTLGNLV